MAVRGLAYTFPTLVMLACDWREVVPNDFLGFAV